MSSLSWPDTVALLGWLGFVLFVVGGAFAGWLELRKVKIAAAQEDTMRQLISRYEQLAVSTLDTQQRVAADLSELRSRTVSIEQILRTVD